MGKLILYYSNFEKISSYKTVSEIYINYLKNKGYKVLAICEEKNNIDYNLSAVDLVSQDIDSLRFDLCILHKEPTEDDLIGNILVQKSKRKIYLFEWYSDTIPKEWNNLLKSVNNYFICNNSNNFPDKIINKEVKYCKDLEYPIKFKYPKQLDELERNKNIFVFFSILDCSSRKGLEDILLSYCNEFNYNEQVVLILKLNNFDENNYNIIMNNVYSKLSKVKIRVLEKKIQIVNHYLSDDDLWSYYNAVDCLITLNKGWNKELFVNECIQLNNCNVTRINNNNFDNVFCREYNYLDLSKQQWKSLNYNEIQNKLRLCFDNGKIERKKEYNVKELDKKNNEKLEMFLGIIENTLKQNEKLGIYV